MLTKKEQLRNAVSQADKIYIDTCSLMQDKIEYFLQDFFKIVSAQNKRPEVIILQKVLDELESNRHNPQKSLTDRKKAEKAVDLVWEYEKKKYFIRYGSAQDAFADASFLSEFSQKRLNNRILYISEDIKNINAIGAALNQPNLQIAQRGYPVAFFSIKSGTVYAKKKNEPSARPHQNIGTSSPPNRLRINTTNPQKPFLRKLRPKNVKKPGVPPSKFTQRDGNRELTVELLDGDGVFFNKGLFKRSSKKLSIILDVSYKGDGKINSMEASFKTKDGSPLIKPVKQGRNKYTLEIADIQFPNVVVTIEGDVKIGLTKVKPFKITISKNY